MNFWHVIVQFLDIKNIPIYPRVIIIYNPENRTSIFAECMSKFAKGGIILKNGGLGRGWLDGRSEKN